MANTQSQGTVHRALTQLRVPSVARDLVHWSIGVEDEVELASIHLPRVLLRCPGHRELDPVGVGRPKIVGRRIPGRVAHERQGLAPHVAGCLLPFGGRRGEVELLRAFDHVRPGRHQNAAVAVVMALGRAETGSRVPSDWVGSAQSPQG